MGESHLHRHSIMLTGGRSVVDLYKSLSVHINTHSYCPPSDFFLTDERNVSPTSHESNFKLITDHFFSKGVPNGSFFYSYELALSSMEDVATKYASVIPDQIDIMILSLGEDGHIASLFPNSPALSEIERKVVPVVGTKAPFQRFTITPPVIQAAKKVYVLAIGDEKRRKYEEALLDPEDISSIPARLVLDRTWIFDLCEEIDLCPKP